jgi:carbon monoxide dehydrogenase subunit G
MKLEQSFTVAAPADEVWRALIDVQRVAPCLPGAEVTERRDDGVYDGTFSVKVGPTTVAYRGTLRLEELDEATRTAVMAARGTDKRGQGGASATIRSTVREEGDATAVDVVTDFSITGRLARIGRGGVVEEVSRRLLRDFAACLQARLVATGDEAEGLGEVVGAAPEGAPAGAEGATGQEAARAGAEGATGQEAARAAATAEPEAAQSAPAAPRRPPAAPVAEGAGVARPLDVGRLGTSVLRDRVRRWWARLGRRLRRIGL